MAKARLAFRPILLLILLVTVLILPSEPLLADELRWSRVNTPADGEPGRWALASGSDLRCLTQASDGTLYCYANPASTEYRLFKSADKGKTWSPTGRVMENLTDIAVVAGKASSIYYATESSIYRSEDGGNSFSTVSRNPGGAGTANILITSIDAALFEGNELVVLGTRDIDSGQFGGVYILDESQDFILIDASIGNYDICAVALSPDFGSSGQIVAVVTNETDTVITTRYYNSGWGDYVGNSRIPGLAPKSATIGFPDYYDSSLDNGNYIQFITIDTGQGHGDVYRLTGQESPAGSIAADLNVALSEGLVELDITSLGISGNGEGAYLIAGAADSNLVYLSQDSGASWTFCDKAPSGSGAVYILMAPDFASSGVVYSVTSGAESAFSISHDKGKHWSQMTLIDTSITNIKDLAVSTGYQNDNVLFLLTGGSTDSLWCSTDRGLNWERILSTAQPQLSRMSLVTLSPGYSQDKTVFLAGTENTEPVIWKSEDKGQSFRKYLSIDPQTGAQVPVDIWSTTPTGLLIIGSYDGSNGCVYRTTDTSPYYSEKVSAGTLPLYSLAVSPDYLQDLTVLAGNINGQVFYSEGGSVFKQLPPDAATPPLSGNISVAFDPGYRRNKTVYAASDAKNGGIYRFVIGKSHAWEPIDGSLPEEAGVSQVVSSTAGTLYGIYSRNVAGENNKGGLERSLNPTSDSGAYFETVTDGVNEEAFLKKLWLQGNTLWTVDSTGGALLTYADSLTLPVRLISPENLATGLSIGNVAISWESRPGATGYHWQVDTDADFSDISGGFEGHTGATSVRLKDLDADITYYWRVRASEPVTSPWSETRAFTAVLEVPLEAPEIIEPQANLATSLKPNFRWSTCAGATGYELQLALDESFHTLIIDKTGDKACINNVWSCDRPLQYDTTYYWRVRAMSGSRSGDWAIGLFTTENAPVTLSTPSAVPPPSVSLTLSITPSSSPSVTSTPTPSPSTPAVLPAEGSGLSSFLVRLVIALGASVGVLAIGLIVIIFIVAKKPGKP